MWLLPMTINKRIKKKVSEIDIFGLIVLSIKRFLSPGFGVTLCVLIRLIKPLIFIRLGSLHAYKIGPFASHPELYLCEKEHGIQPNKTMDIFISDITSFICNHQLHKMWKRLLYVNDIFLHAYKIMIKMPFANEHIINTSKDSRDIHGLFEKTDPHLEFLTEEIDQAKQDLSRMNIGPEDKYVLVLNRGQRYLNEMFPNQKWYWPNHEWRNVSINDYKPAMKEIVSKGYYVIRVGHLVSDLMNIDNPKIIEYDHDGFRTDLLDIYLGANCRYLLTSDSGYQAVAWIFRRPVLNISCVSIEYLLHYLPSWLSIFSKYWLKPEKRFMKIPEIIKSGAGGLKSGQEYEKWGIEVIKNTPDEILEAVNEMEGRLDGTWQTTDDDDEIQRRFWSHFKLSPLHNSDGKLRGRIGANFLKENEMLF